MRKLLVVVAVAVMCLAVASGSIAQSIQKVNDQVKIDWTNLVYIVEGHGAIPKPEVVPNRAIAKLKARDYAKMDAIANLQMAIEGTAISYESVGKDYMADTTIRQKIEGFVKNVQFVEERVENFEGDKMVIVKMKAPMFGGDNAPGSVFTAAPTEDQPPAEPTTEAPLEPATEPAVEPAVVTETEPSEATVEASVKVVLKADKPSAVQTVQAVEATSIDPNAPDVTTAAKPSVPGAPYTGLIIDAAGYKLQRAMSPKIRKQDGSAVWGGSNASPDLVVEKGIVSYVTTIGQGKLNKRAGANPLVIRCIGRAGGKFSCDPVISDGDAEILEYENGKSKFLDDLNVVIVKDPAY